MNRAYCLVKIMHIFLGRRMYDIKTMKKDYSK